MVSSRDTEVSLGAFRGSISFTKFHVRGDLPADFRDRFVEAIRLRTFRELDATAEADQGIGWCGVDQPFELDLVHEKVFYGDYLNLGLRTDAWRIPSSLFKASFREAERELLGKQGGEKLTRSQKKNLEAVVVRALRQRVVPAMSVVDLSWSLGDRVVRFFHQSPKQHEAMIALFEKTFGLELAEDGAYLTAEKRGLESTLLERLHQLEPMSLATQNA